MENTVTNGPARPECAKTPVLAMARVPMQNWSAIYEPEVALSRGTLFPPLDLPLIGKEVR